MTIQGGGVWTMLAGRRATAVTGIVMLTIMFCHRVSRLMPAKEADNYHARVRAAAIEIPRRVGSWVATELPPPEGAISLLHPNVVMALRYEDTQSHRKMTYEFIQCRDARDMLGHYPPICYLSQGWELQASSQRDWHLGERVVHGMEYSFSSKRVDRPYHITVENVILMPDGGSCRDLEAVNRAAKDFRKRYFGAAQLQIIFETSLSKAEERSVFQSFLEANGDLVKMVGSGETR